MTPEMSTAAAEKRARLRKRAVDKVASDTPQRGSRASRPRKAPPEAADEEMAERVHRFDDRVGEFDGDVGLEEDGVGERSGGVRLWSNGWRGVSKENEEDSGNETECCFIGDPIDVKEAEEKWPHRYEKKAAGSWDASTTGKSLTEEDIKARRHYLQAKVDGIVYDLNDCAYVKAGEGEDSFICRIVEFFEGANRQLYFTAQWFYRAKDTVIKENAGSHDPRRVFQSEDRNDNPLECLVSKIKIVLVKPNIDLEKKTNGIPECDLYYDMSYSTKYSSFTNIPYDKVVHGSPISSLTSESESSDDADTGLSLLDLYSGCGAMSTGLCLGANFGGTQLETRWAVDMSIFACESLKLNHPRAEVRNEDAENFLALLLEWEKLCRRFSLIGTESYYVNELYSDNLDGDGEAGAASDVPSGEFEVGKLVGICYGDPSKIGKVGLKFKVRWKGYGPSEDTWEPIDGLSKCQERIKDFVQSGYKRNILPLPGRVDVICGGPPCQGISGFNRFRRFDAPLKDPKNKQIVVFMDIVEFLKPRYVLMENVVDILKFARGFLGRYALSRLVAMNYQTRMGLMVAGCYGLPQFRMRVFLWGAVPTEKLPQFPFPTHDVVVRGGAPQEFEANLVAYDETQRPKLQKALLLADAISDLPPVTNAEATDEMPHEQSPKTNFQHYIRLSSDEMSKVQAVDRKPLSKGKLFDHRPLELNEDDYQRVCQIPREKGANFRHLAGVKVGEGNVVEWDPTVPRVYLPSGKPLVPDYAMSFIKGKSTKPFGRLWWDETVPTVVTRAEPHNQVILHPEQDRVLSVRENARLQGFPDYYQLRGPIKERYIQVGNAVAVPVARALGVALANALNKLGTEDALFELPSGFTTQRH